MRRNSLFLVLSFFLLFGCRSQTFIINSIPERDANEIIVLLASKGIPATKSAAVSGVGGGTGDQKWDVGVPAAQVAEALSILNQAGLPRVKGTSLLDLFGTQGLVPSDMQDKIRYQEGLSEQLASTIRKMDGIIDANVQITFPQEEAEQQVLTASVYVKHRGILDNPNSLTITKIKRLVSSAIPNLTPENVSVVTDRALYADISLEPIQAIAEEPYFVSIWSIIVAKQSSWRFRLIFYTFLLLFFVLASALSWLAWKFWLVLEKAGWKTLLLPEQYTIEGLTKKEGETPTEGGGKE